MKLHLTNIKSTEVCGASLASIVIFPDEKCDDEENDDLGPRKITTRSGRKYSAGGLESPSVSAAPEIQSTSKATFLRIYESLTDWKKSTLCFNECQELRCDPLGKFLSYNRGKTCKKCKIIRKVLHKELIFICDRDELFDLILNYNYFHAIKVFDMKAEQRYALDRPNHPYFAAYKRLRQLTKLVLDNIVASYDISHSMQLLAQRVFIFQEIFTQGRKSKSAIADVIRCEICADSLDPNTDAYHQIRRITLCGKRYGRRDFQFIEEATELETKQFWLCGYHGNIFDCFYKLTHMEWNVYLNCYLRITRLHEANPDLSAEQLINEIDPTIFSKLAKSYLHIFKRLNYEWWRWGNKEWAHFVYELKNGAIFKRISWMR